MKTKALAVSLASVLLISPFAYAEDLSLDDLDSDSLFEEDDLFDDESFADEDTDALLDQPLYEFWWQHTLVYDPDSFSKPTNHESALHLQAETTIGLSGYADIDLQAKQNWNNGELDTEVRSTTLQLSTEQGAIKLGRYINSWGEVEGAGVLDVINPAPSMTDTDREFKPEWLVAYNHYMGPRELQVFVNVDPQVTPMPGFATTQQANKEWGLRYKVTGSGSDWAAYMGRFVQNAGVLGVINNAPAVQANEYDLVGYSYNRAIDDDLLKLDMAWKSGLAHYASGTFKAVDRFDIAVGAEINDGDRQWLISLIGNYLPDHSTAYQQVAMNPVTQAVTMHAVDAWSGSYSLGVSDSFGNEEFSWNIMANGAVNGNFSALLAEFTWDYSDHVIWRFYAAAMQAKVGTAFAAMDGFQRVGVQFEQHF
jgi:hypothetical protein